MCPIPTHSRKCAIFTKTIGLMDILASSFALFFFEYGHDHDRFLARKGGLPDRHLKHVHSRCQLVNLHANSWEPFLPAWSLVNLVHLHSAVWPSLAWCTRIKQDTLVDLKAGSSLLCFVITKGAASMQIAAAVEVARPSPLK